MAGHRGGEGGTGPSGLTPLPEPQSRCLEVNPRVGGIMVAGGRGDRQTQALVPTPVLLQLKGVREALGGKGVERTLAWSPMDLGLNLLLP